MEVAINQQTDSWLQWRKNVVGSSDACIIMKSVDWSTPYELWRDKTGLPPRQTKKGSNFAIELGNRFEPVARSLFELQSTLDFDPKVFVSKEFNFMAASLDGWNEKTKSILEIKNVRGEVFDFAQKGEAHPKYVPQLQHQLFVAQAERLFFFVCKLDKPGHDFRITETALVEVLPDKEYIKELIFAEKQFYNFVEKKIPPPLSDKDYVWADDASTVALFKRIKESKGKTEFEEIREEAIEHVETEFSHPRVYANGVSMIKTKKGHWMILIE